MWSIGQERALPGTGSDLSNYQSSTGQFRLDELNWASISSEISLALIGVGVVVFTSYGGSTVPLVVRRPDHFAR